MDVKVDYIYIYILIIYIYIYTDIDYIGLPNKGQEEGLVFLSFWPNEFWYFLQSNNVMLYLISRQCLSWSNLN